MIMGSVSVQMAQVAGPAEFGAEFAFVAKDDSCTESWSECRESILQKLGGESAPARSSCVKGCCARACACVCVCVGTSVSLVHLTDSNCCLSPELTN